jgi:hypothetical protein
LCARGVARVARARGARHRAQVGSHCLLCCIGGEENGGVEYWALLLSKDIERGSASAGTTRGRHGHVYFVAMVFSDVLASNASAAWSALACRLCLGGVGRIEAMPAPRAMLSTHNASRSLDAINLKAVISAYDDNQYTTIHRSMSVAREIHRLSLGHQTFFGIHHLVPRLL